ncbi:MAG: hypothetical protein ACREDS_15505, partial [Limisphaerales bacterium]
NDPTAQWGNYNGARHFFEVDWNYTNGVSVKMDGSAIFSNVAVPGFTPQAGDRFVWAARCGGITEEVRLDNIIMMTGGNLVQTPATRPYYGDSGTFPDPNFTPAAFDGDNDTFWLSNLNGPTWYVGAGVSPANAVVAYVLTAGPEQGLPAAWTFDGSAGSDTNWTSLANGAVNFINYNETRAFPAANTNTFGVYRINITANNGASSETTLDEMKFYTFNAVILSPVVATTPASPVNIASANLNGQVNPNSSPTTAWFEWGLTTNYGNITANQDAGNSSATVPVAATITGLSAGTTYHCQLVASNSFGTIFGGDVIFTTGIPTIPWTQTSATNNYWYAIASSSDGTKLAAVADEDADENPGSIYTSTNSGTTWTQTSATSNHWYAIA